LILIAAIYFWRWENSRDETDLTVLPLNGGHAVFVDAAGRKNDWLMDCGDENAVNSRSNLSPRAGREQNSAARADEGDARDCGGAESLNELFGVGELWTSPAHFRSTAYRDQPFRGLTNRRRATKSFNAATPPAAGRFCIRTRQIIFPRRRQRARAARKFSRRKILLLSDLSRAGQAPCFRARMICARTLSLPACPNEGEPLCDALLDAIQPKVIVIADSEFPGHAAREPRIERPAGQRNSRDLHARFRRGDHRDERRLAGGWKLRTMDGQKFSSVAAA
jgi:hypothetical protein